MRADDDVPSAAEEARFFARVERLQAKVAAGASRHVYGLALVPTWTLQMLLYALALRTQPVRFIDLTRHQADAGSRVFQDYTTWPGDESTVQEVSRSVEDLSDGALRVLIGRALDYGRTLHWTTDGSIIERERDLATSKTQGIFYTPAFVADYLARRGLRNQSKGRIPNVCDPAVGGGIFLLAAARALLEVGTSQQIRGRLYGVDTDPLAAETSAVLVDSALGWWNVHEMPPSLGVNIIVGDSFGGPVTQSDGPGVAGGVSWFESFPAPFQERGGFDLVLLNPPFGRYKVDSDWLVAKEMRLDPNSLKLLKEAGRSRAKSLRDTGWYPLASVGVLDKSRIGLERAMQLTASGGRVAAIVPTTLTADVNSSKLRKSLLNDWTFEEANEFPEAARLFNDVSQSTSAIVAQKGGRTKDVAVRSGIRSEADLNRGFSGEWPVGLIERLSPKCPIPVRAGPVSDLLETIHRHQTIGDVPGLVNARGEVDLTIFSAALTKQSNEMRLVRGDQVDCYRNNLISDKDGYIRRQTFTQRLQSSPKFHHSNQIRLVGRQCSYLYRRKRLSFAIVPSDHAVANSCNYLTGLHEDQLFYLLAFLNSEVLNWRFGITNSNNHVANSEIAELPIPNFLQSNSLVDDIVARSRSLSEEFRPEIDAELDELVATAYGLTARQHRQLRELRRLPDSRVVE